MPYLNEVSPENIRIWAYDDELYFLEQDEDLMLHKPEFIPTLIELAGQERCPKQEYIKAILEYYIQWCFLYKREDQLAEINSHISNSRASLSTEWLILWHINFQYIYAIYKRPQRLTEAACQKIAKDLTVGDYCKREFSALGALKDGSLEFSATTESFKLYFYINPLNGEWKISKGNRLLKFD